MLVTWFMQKIHMQQGSSLLQHHDCLCPAEQGTTVAQLDAVSKELFDCLELSYTYSVKRANCVIIQQLLTDATALSLQTWCACNRPVVTAMS